MIRASTASSGPFANGFLDFTTFFGPSWLSFVCLRWLEIWIFALHIGPPPHGFGAVLPKPCTNGVGPVGSRPFEA